jgi:hypothetical protein
VGPIIKSFILFSSLAYGVVSDCNNCDDHLRGSMTPMVPEWPIEYTTIEKVTYERNTLAKFCRRPAEMVDTIVLHHSETPSIITPEQINNFHLSRGASDDPWYMIAYSYIISAPYPEESTPDIRVAEGRPIDIVGAHAGKGILVPMDSLQKKVWAEGQITCGKENGDFRPDPKLERNGRISANVTTLGIVVIGNYAPFSKLNPTGFPIKKPRLPTKDTQDLIARTSCQLQKKHPRIKYIKWHSFYHSTSCPGTIKQYLGKIKSLARKYGCTFN